MLGGEGADLDFGPDPNRANPIDLADLPRDDATTDLDALDVGGVDLNAPMHGLALSSCLSY